MRDVVQANYLASQANGVWGAFNIARGARITITALARLMGKVSGLEPRLEYCSPRKGDVQHSLANVSAAHMAFAYQPTVSMEEGLREYMQWAKEVL